MLFPCMTAPLRPVGRSLYHGHTTHVGRCALDPNCANEERGGDAPLELFFLAACGRPAGRFICRPDIARRDHTVVIRVAALVAGCVTPCCHAYRPSRSRPTLLPGDARGDPRTEDVLQSVPRGRDGSSISDIAGGGDNFSAVCCAWSLSDGRLMGQEWAAEMRARSRVSHRDLERHRPSPHTRSAVGRGSAPVPDQVRD